MRSCLRWPTCEWNSDTTTMRHWNFRPSASPKSSRNTTGGSAPYLPARGEDASVLRQNTGEPPRIIELLQDVRRVYEDFRINPLGFPLQLADPSEQPRFLACPLCTPDRQHCDRPQHRFPSASPQFLGT